MAAGVGDGWPDIRATVVGAARRRPIVEITLDCAHVPTMAAFQSVALGHEVIDAADGQACLRDPANERPFLCLREVPETEHENRMHFDLVVTDEDDDDESRGRKITDEVERLGRIGASVRGEQAPRFAGMQDPEGNECDVT